MYPKTPITTRIICKRFHYSFEGSKKLQFSLMRKFEENKHYQSVPIIFSISVCILCYIFVPVFRRAKAYIFSGKVTVR